MILLRIWLNCHCLRVLSLVNRSLMAFKNSYLFLIWNMPNWPYLTDTYFDINWQTSNCLWRWSRENRVWLSDHLGVLLIPSCSDMQTGRFPSTLVLLFLSFSSLANFVWDLLVRFHCYLVYITYLLVSLLFLTDAYLCIFRLKLICTHRNFLFLFLPFLLKWSGDE